LPFFRAANGIASLHRPKPNIAAFLLSLGLGNLLMVSLYLVCKNLLTESFRPAEKPTSTPFCSDIQPSQETAPSPT